MKKIILIILLFVSVLIYSQEKRQVYSYVSYTSEDVVKAYDAENTFYFEYNNQPLIKIYGASDSVIYFDRLSEIKTGFTENNSQYKIAFYKQRGTDLKVIIQVFDSIDYGCRIIFETGDSLQFFLK